MLRNLSRAARLTRLSALRRSLSVSIPRSQEEDVTAKNYEFQAETKKLLDIVAKSLYSEHEIFVRELISNASDALNKRKFEEMENGGEPPALDIRLSFNKTENLLIIEDNGIGMSEQEAITNLGTIAKSGSLDFMGKIEGEHSESAKSIIGQFGVGFYSVFMVADEVDVLTRRWDSEQGIHWRSTGDDGYTIESEDNIPAGSTRIQLKLKSDYREFADPDHVKKIAQKYSSFTAFPLYCNEEHINQVEPIWMLEKNKISDETYKTFYRHISGDPNAESRFHLYYKTEMPISVRSIFYIPMERPKFGGQSADDHKSEIALYCRKVLISNKTDMILPTWLRFVKGVVDSEEIPLNLSRELLQNTPLISKIKDTLTDRVIKFLNDKAKRQAEEYQKFYLEHKYFISEGIVIEENSHRKDEIAKLLRYESSALGNNELTSLDDYIGRMKDDQRYIFFLPAKTRSQALNSPYLESIKKKGLEVLFFYDMFDEMVMEQLGQFKDKVPFSIENDIIEDSIDGENVEDTLLDDTIPTADQENLVEWAKKVLGEKAQDVVMTSKLENQPGMITVWNLGVVRNFLRQQKMTNPDNKDLFEEEELAKIATPKLQLSKTHPVVKHLLSLKESDPELAESVLAHIYSTSMITAGINDDPISIANKSNALIEKLLNKL